MQSLATKYRPKTFSEICSQESIIKILTKQIETNQIKNAYLFAGSSGCGKTTSARAFASMINKGLGNPIEIDAASNSGVDNVRDIIKTASERALDAEYKIIIIDECHALSNQAWQAFLKTIEEPPTYTIFIFCTTDPQKIPSTILNRVMRFNFNRIDSQTIYQRLLYICEQEHFTNYTDTCEFISRTSKGQMRDAIATLEKCASYNTSLDLKSCLHILGNYDYDVYFKLLNAIIDGNEAVVLQILDDLYLSGGDLKLFVSELFRFVLDVNKYLLFKDCSVTNIPSSYKKDLDIVCNFENSKQYYNYLMDQVLQLYNLVKTETDLKTFVEIYLLKIARLG